MAKHQLDNVVHSTNTKRRRCVKSVLKELLDDVEECCARTTTPCDGFLSSEVREYRGDTKNTDDPSVCDNFAIVWASVSGREDLVEELLMDSRVDPSARYNSAILWSSEKGYVGIVERLLRDQRVCPRMGGALFKSCTHGHVEVVRIILKDKRVVPDTVHLVEASERGHIKVVELLLQDGRIDPSSEDNRVLSSACKFGRADIVKILLRHKSVDPSFSNNVLIVRVCSQIEEYTGVVKLLLGDERVDPSVDNNHPLQKACIMGHANIVRLLLEGDIRVQPSIVHLEETVVDDKFFNVNKRGNYPGVVRALIEHGLDPSTCNNSALFLASRNGRTDVVETLLKDRRVDPTVRGNACIIEASGAGHLGVVNALIKDRRADVAVDSNAPIRVACWARYVGVVKSLLSDERVDPSALNNMALRSAAECMSNHIGFKHIVKLLLTDLRVVSSLDSSLLQYNRQLILRHITKQHGYKIVYMIRDKSVVQVISTPSVDTGLLCLDDTVHTMLIREVMSYV